MKRWILKTLWGLGVALGILGVLYGLNMCAFLAMTATSSQVEWANRAIRIWLGITAGFLAVAVFSFVMMLRVRASK